MDGPAGIDGDQIDGFIQLKVQGIAALAHNHVWMVAQFGVQDIGGGVDRKDACGAVLQQAVCETTHMAAQIGAHQAADVEAGVRETVQCMGEFTSAS